MSGLRDTILANQPASEPVPQVDWEGILSGLDAIGKAVAALRIQVESQMTPKIGENGECLHPLADRREASSFSQHVEFCGRCGEMV
jgi:hypothetical protein